MSFSRIGAWILLITAFLPLVVAKFLFYPTVAPKEFFLYTLVLLALAFFGVGVAHKEKFYWSRLKNFWVLTPVILLVIAYITSIFGYSFYHSFWSGFERAGGLLSMTMIMLAGYMMILTFRKEDRDKFFYFISIGAGFVAIYALLQWLTDVFSFSLPGIFIAREGRIGGTLGNAAFLAGYLGISTWLSFIGLNYAKGFWRKFILYSIPLQILAIIATATRGTILAMIAVAILFALWSAIKEKGLARMLSVGALAGTLIIVAGFFSMRTQLQNSPIEPVRRIAQISKADATTSSRLFIWGEVFKHIKEHPMGVGSENINVVFNKFYDPTKIVEQWFDRTHNMYLDYLVQYGFLGLIAFLLVLGTMLVKSVRMYMKGNKEGVFIFLAILTYMLQNIFVFDSISTLAILFAIFALLFIDEDEASLKDFKFSEIAGSALAVVSGLLIIPVVVLPFFANLMMGFGYTQHVADVPKAVGYFDAGLSLHTFADLEYGYQAYEMYIDRQQHLDDPSAVRAAYDYTFGVLSKNFEKYPYDARTAVYLGHVIDAHPSSVPYDEAFEEKVLEKAMELSPKRSQPIYMLANIYIRKGDAATGAEKDIDYTKATKIIQDYAHELPTFAEPRFIIANQLFLLGKKQEAAAEFAEGEKFFNGDPSVAKNALKYLFANKLYDKALPYMEIVEKQYPTIENKYDLAKLLFISGDVDGAIELTQEVLNKDSNYAQTSDPAFYYQISQVAGGRLNVK